MEEEEGEEETGEKRNRRLQLFGRRIRKYLMKYL